MTTTNASGLSRFLPGTLSRDLVASLVVFLVAMPLCMGIAIASGVPPERGLVTGIIGGIVAGALAGSPLQVSGPAAGLAVIVFEIVRNQGLAALGPILILAGIVQVAAGAARLGQWFRAISPAVVHGMLAGIGVLIVLGQLHVMFDRSPKSHGVDNLAAIPEAFISLTPTLGQTEAAFIIGVATIASMLLWDKYKPAKLRMIPGALLGVVIATFLAQCFALDVKRVVVPESIVGALAFPTAETLGAMFTPTVITTAIAIAFIASAETLLSAAAVDRMHNGVRTKYNKELVAQGVGNALCGLVGALPMTGVIVRSSANVQAGAATRASTIFHGVWILGFVALLPWLMRMIPMASLAGILVVTGWRLISLKHVRHLFQHYGMLPTLVWIGTFVTVITTDLLMGVLVGLALSALELIPHLRRLKLDIQHGNDAANDASEIELAGSATFVQIPRLTKALETLPAEGPLRLTLARLSHIDHTCAEMIKDWIARHRAAGRDVSIDPDGASRHHALTAAH